MAAIECGSLDLRRKAMITYAKPIDNAQEIMTTRSKHFDLDKTIFKSLDSKLVRAVQRHRLDIDPFWSDAAANRIAHAFTFIPRPPSHDKPIFDFMENECNFAMEHADGSFMDHLQFCYEYSHAHFKGHSPRVLLLHSIMGVGTNYFPMDVSLVPKLRTLVTETEMIHVEAFPSVLRLLMHGPLLDQLNQSSDEQLKRSFKGMSFHRVIDNQELTLDTDAFWIQLNYQLVHLLDFLPIANWADKLDDSFMVPFVQLHALLVRADKLMAQVDFQLTPALRNREANPPITLGSVIDKILPSGIKRMMAAKAIAKFSAQVNHSLSYSLQWEAQSRL